MSRRPRVRVGPLGAKRPHRAEVALSRIGRSGAFQLCPPHDSPRSTFDVADLLTRAPSQRGHFFESSRETVSIQAIPE